MITLFSDPIHLITGIFILLVLLLFVIVWWHRKSHDQWKITHDKIDRNYDKLDNMWKVINDTAERMDKIYQSITKK